VKKKLEVSRILILSIYIEIYPVGVRLFRQDFSY